MQVRATKPVVISYVKKQERTYGNGIKYNLWSFSFPVSRKKKPDGSWDTFYQTGWWADKTQSYILQNKQQMNNCLFDILVYIDKNKQRRYAWFLKEYDRTNNGEAIGDDDFNFDDRI